MKIRRVVTGHSVDGRAIVVSDSEVDGTTVDMLPGSEWHELWSADRPPRFPDEGVQLPGSNWFPPVGGFRFATFVVGPKSQKLSEEFNRQLALEELENTLPGMVSQANHKPDNPGMHTSDTIDFEYILSGNVWLELDDGKEIHLKAGDTVVQNGTRHAWRNKSDEPCRMVVFLVGAHRE